MYNLYFCYSYKSRELSLYETTVPESIDIRLLQMKLVISEQNRDWQERRFQI